MSACLAQHGAAPSRRAARKRLRRRTRRAAHGEPQFFAPAPHVGQSVSTSPSFTPEIARERAHGGEPLPAPLAAHFERELGLPAPAARVHTTPESNLLALGVGAQAFTLGRDIFFKPNAYRPAVPDGQRLIAHELTHVVQQGVGRFPSHERIARQPDSDGGLLQGAIGFGAQLLGSGLEAMADRAARQLADNPLAQNINALRAELRNASDPVELPVPAVRRLIEIVENLRGHLPMLLPVPNLAPTIQAVAMVPAVGAIAIPLGLILAVLALILIAALLIAALVQTLAPAIEELIRSLRGALRPARAPLPAPAPAPPVARPVPPPPVTAPRVEPKADPTAKPIPVPVPIPIPRELDRNRRRTACDIQPLGFHLGGGVRHNACADLKPPNVFPGSDARVTTPSKRSKNFDALSPTHELWEVKTGSDAGGDFSANSEFVQRMQLQSDAAEIRQEKSIAGECGLPFVFAVSDPVRLSELSKAFPDVTFKLVDC